MPINKVIVSIAASVALVVGLCPSLAFAREDASLMAAPTTEQKHR